MSGRPLSGRRSDDKTLSAGNGHSWSACAIANSIVHTIARSYMWLPQLKPDDAEQNGGEPEYTSEHLEEALIALKTSESSPEATERDVAEEIVEHEEVVIKTETLECLEATIMIDSETMSPTKDSADSEMSTEISYTPANPEQTDQNIEIKPNVETVSTQSTADRVKLNTQTTTEDLPAPPTLPQALVETDANRNLKKSKVPVLKPDHTSCPASCVNMHDVNTQSKPAKAPPKFAHSKIPQLLSLNQTPSLEQIPLTAVPSRTSTMRGRNGRVNGGPEMQLIENALLDSTIHSKPAGLKLNGKELSKEGEDKENQEMVQHLMRYKMAKEINQQTDETDHEKHLEIEEICKNLIDNIQIVENVLDSLPSDGAANLRAFCEAYNYAPAHDACTMSNDLQKNSHCQSETKDDDESRKLYEEQVYKNNQMVSALEYDSDHIDSTTGDIDQMPKQIAEISAPSHVATIDEENDDDYEDYDDEEDAKQDKMADTLRINVKHAQRKVYNRLKAMNRESKTCIMGTSNLTANRSVLNMPMSCALPSKEAKESINKVVTNATCKPEAKPAEKNSKKEEEKKPAVTAIETKATIATKANAKQQIENGGNQLNAIANMHETQALEAVAYEANIFNIIQSQKINNILRMAMPYNNLLLPVFVSSPSSIMHTLEQELRHTLETKKQTALYFSAANAVIEQKLSAQAAAKPKARASNKMATKQKDTHQKSTCAPPQRYWLNGFIIGPQVIAQDQATWAKPPFYYGPYKAIQ